MRTQLIFVSFSILSLWNMNDCIAQNHSEPYPWKLFTNKSDTLIAPIFESGEKGYSVKYSHEARRNKIQGTVIVAYIIETDGFVRECFVEKGLGYGLDEEACNAVKILNLKFKPGYINGVPVRVKMQQQFVFTLQE